VSEARSDWAPDPAHPLPTFKPPRRVPHGVTLIGRLFEEGTLGRVGVAMERAFNVSGERPADFNGSKNLTALPRAGSSAARGERSQQSGVRMKVRVRERSSLTQWQLGRTTLKSRSSLPLGMTRAALGMTRGDPEPAASVRRHGELAPGLHSVPSEQYWSITQRKFVISARSVLISRWRYTMRLPSRDQLTCSTSLGKEFGQGIGQGLRDAHRR